MDSLKKVFQAIGCAWLIIVAIIGLGGTWLTHNMDTVAEAGMEAAYNASGEKDRRCQYAEDAYDRLWEEAVDTNRLDAMQDQLDRAQAEVERACGTN